MIYFTRCVNSQSIKMLSLHYHELLGKIEKHEGKKIFDIWFFVLGGVVDKIKEIIGIEKFDDTKILINADDELSVKKSFDINDMLLKMAINFIHSFYTHYNT